MSIYLSSGFAVRQSLFSMKMKQKGFAALPLVIIAAAVLMIGGVILFSAKVNQSPSETPSTVSDQNPQPQSTSRSNDQPESSSSTKPSASDVAKTTCDTSKDVCFESSNPVITIQEGYLDDANHWIAELTITGQGSGGYETTINGFPKEISVRAPDQNFPNGSKGQLYLRAQKDVTKKGTYSGTISIRSRITNKTHTINLTIIYTDWNSSAIHTNPAQIVMDCKIVDGRYNKDDKEFSCGAYESQFLKFYYFKNNRTIEIRSVKADNSKSKSLQIDTELYHKSILEKGNDVYSLFFYVDGWEKELKNEPNGTYKGEIQFVDQSTQKEIIHVPYTITIHAYSP